MAGEMTRWGILYCPKAGISNKRKRWEKIQKVLDDRHVEYDFVQSETADSVERLTKMMISNGYKTIIVVGGDSALNDAVNCLMMEEKIVRDSIALGVIPNGIMNDFARFWSFNEDDIEQTVDWLVKRRLRKVDLGCIRYSNAKGEKCHRYFLNCVNIGMTADIMNLRRQTRRLFGSRTLSFISSLFVMFFHRMEYKMKLKINSDEIDRKVMTMCIGSGPGYGQTPNAVPYNGMIDVTVMRNSAFTQIFSAITLFLRGKILNHKMILPYRCHDITIKVPKNTPISIDGHSFSDIDTSTDPMKVIVEQEAINFIIEK